MRQTKRYAKARAYLGQVRKADDRVKWLVMRLENLRMLAMDPAKHEVGMPASGNADQDRTGRIMGEIDEMERRIEEAREEARRIREEVGMKVYQISDPIVQKAIILHDLDYHTCEEIAGIMLSSRTQVYRWRNEGYAELEELI